MALTALNRQPQDALPNGVHAVEHRFHAELFRVNTALFVQHRITQESRRNQLILCPVGQQVSGQLLDEKLVVIAGKGHETGQIIGDRVLPFSDAQVARAAVDALDGKGT